MSKYYYLPDPCPQCGEQKISEHYGGYADITDFHPHVEKIYYMCHTCKWQLKKLVDLSGKTKNRYIAMIFTDKGIQYKELNM